MFSYGQFWLDTNIILPLLAETLCPGESRRYTRLLAAALESGCSLQVTDGVIEEVERHMNRAKVYSEHKGTWTGGVPFLYSTFLWSDRGGSFNSWIDTFMGPSRPLDDVADYLRDNFGIRVVSLSDTVAQATLELRGAVTEYWQGIHGQRREDSDLDQMTIDRLIQHDVENCLGVAIARGDERKSALGYRSWWLTLDRGAYRALSVAYQRLGWPRTPVEVALSPDFLSTYLTVGPARSSLSRMTEHALPLMLDMSVTQVVPQEFISVVEEVRGELLGLPISLRRRRIRDTLDLMKRKKGPLAEGGAKGAMDTIKRILTHGAP
jgi:hypothetical protein